MEITIQRNQGMKGMLSQRATFTITVTVKLNNEEHALVVTRGLSAHMMTAYPVGNQEFGWYISDVINQSKSFEFPTFVQAESFIRSVKGDFESFKGLIELAARYPPGHIESYQL